LFRFSELAGERVVDKSLSCSIMIVFLKRWWRWIAEINFLRFVNDAVFVSQFAGQIYNCTQTNTTSSCLYPTGDAFLLSLGIDPNLNIGLFALYTLICMFVFHGIGFLCVHFFYKI
jgi:hypothetical protein